MLRSCMLLIFFLFAFHCNVEAAKKRKAFSSKAEADQYLNIHYNKGCSYYSKESWGSAMDEFEKVIHFFPNSSEAAESYYFLGICYFQKKEYDFANRAFSNYLTASEEPPYYEDAVYYKYCIAEHFRLGKRRRLLTYRYFPKWLPGESLALTIYDEVVIALPNHELAVAALHAKGQLLQKMGNFREAVETYQLLIRRFPKHELAPGCYLNIAEAYCQQSLYEFQNPDLLALAELNVRKFQEDFPRDDRINLAEGYVCRMKEMYAKGLCDVGCFYDRICQPEAAAIYYQSAMEEFPDTAVAKYCRGRLKSMGRMVEEEAVNPPCNEETEQAFEQDDILAEPYAEEPENPYFMPENRAEEYPTEPYYHQEMMPAGDWMANEEEQEADAFGFYQNQAFEQPFEQPLMQADANEWYSEGQNYFYEEPALIPIVQEEKEAPVPYYIHYSLLKKRQVQKRSSGHH